MKWFPWTPARCWSRRRTGNSLSKDSEKQRPHLPQTQERDADISACAPLGSSSNQTTKSCASTRLSVLTDTEPSFSFAVLTPRPSFPALMHSHFVHKALQWPFILRFGSHPGRSLRFCLVRSRLDPAGIACFVPFLLRSFCADCFQSLLLIRYCPGAMRFPSVSAGYASGFFIGTLTID